MAQTHHAVITEFEGINFEEACKVQLNKIDTGESVNKNGLEQ